MKRFIAAALAAALCVGLAGCGSADSSSKADASPAQNSTADAAPAQNSTADAAPAQDSTADAPAAASGVTEPDLMGFFFSGKGKNYLGMNLSDLNADFGGVFDESHAVEYDKSFGQATYSLGEVDAILGGKAKFGGKLPVTLTIYFDGERITKFLYKIEEGSVDSAAVCHSISDALQERLPSDYKGEYDYKPAGKDSARFANDVNGYVFEVKHMSLDDTGYPVMFTMESYKDKYGQ